MSREFNQISQLLETCYRTERGRYLEGQLQAALDQRLETAFGYHILQVGPVHGEPLFGSCRIRNRILAGPGPAPSVNLYCEASELPLESDSVDVVIAHHALEFSDRPHQVLRELQRVLTPHGQLLLTGWNPHSALGLARRLRAMAPSSPWHEHHPVGTGRLSDWLHLLGFEIEDTLYLYHLPPFGSGRLRAWLSRGDRWCSAHHVPMGGLYLMRAVKQVAAHNRPRTVRRRGEALIGLAVPKPAAAPSVHPINGASREEPARR